MTKIPHVSNHINLDPRFPKFKINKTMILEDNINSPISCQSLLDCGANAFIGPSRSDGFHLLSPNGEQVMNYVGQMTNTILGLLQPQISSNQTSIATNVTGINNVGSRTTSLEFQLSQITTTTSIALGNTSLPTSEAVFNHVAGRQLQLRKRDDHLTEIRRNVATASSSLGVTNEDDRIATCAAIQQYVTSVCDILDEPQTLMSADLQTTYATRVLNGRTVYRAMDEFISSYTVPISNANLLQANYLVDGSITNADMLWLTGGHLTTAPLAGTNLRAELNTLHQGMSTTVSPFSVPSFTSYRISTGKYGIVFDSSKRPTSHKYTVLLTMQSATSEGTPGDETHLDDYQLAWSGKSTLGFKYYVKENDDNAANGVFRDCRVDFACFSRGECFCHGTVNDQGVKDVEPATSTPLIVTFDGVVLDAVYYGLPLTMNSSSYFASWGDIDYLPAIGTTNARNNSLNTTATVVINSNVIAFMVRFDAHNWSDVDVDVSSWTLSQSSTGPSNTDHFLQTGNSYSTKLYTKFLSAGTHTLDDTAAWYFFMPL